MRLIEVGGSADDIGRTHGRQLADEIRACIDIYRLVLARDDEELRRSARHFRERTRAFSPAIADEIDGIAAGAKVDVEWIYVLNARSELMAGVVDGCTAVFLPEVSTLAQTWDWLQALESLVSLVRIEPASGPTVLTLTEPGIVAKIGCNSSGLGVCLNFLYAPGPLRGVPVHVVLRALLDANDLDTARALVHQAGVGRAANVLVGVADGSAMNVQYTGEQYVVHDITGSPFTVTNHVDGRPESGGPLHANSVARGTVAAELARRAHTVDEVVALLADQGDALHPICAPYRPYLGAAVGTVATVVMELADRRMRVSSGPERKATQLHPVI